MKYMDYILETLERIVNTPSPSGYTKEVMGDHPQGGGKLWFSDRV